MTIERLEVLVEERSMAVALEALLPKIVPDVDFEIRDFSGKSDLLTKLPQRLRGYATWVEAANVAVVVVVDQDRDDCRELKSRIVAACDEVQLSTHSILESRVGRVLPRVAVEELEAWFFGDVQALVDAYPGVPPTLASKAAYRDADAIAGGTWEALERVLQRAGHHTGGLPKTIAAGNISRHMTIETNTSMSFQHFSRGVQSLVAQSMQEV